MHLETIQRPKGLSTPRRRRGAVFVVGLALFVPGLFLAVLGGAESAAGPWDRVLVEVVYYDAVNGEPIHATDEEEARRLHEEFPDAPLLDEGAPGFRNPVVPVRRNAELEPTLELFAAQLNGRKPGDVFRSPMDEDGLYRWEGDVEVARVRGPFPMAHEFPRHQFELRYGPPRIGGRFYDLKLTDAVMEVTAADESRIHYRNLVRDGQTIHLRNLGWPALVNVNETSDTFSLVLDPPEGSRVRLSCENAILSDLDPGTAYEVRSVDPHTIRLAYAPYAFPHLVDRPVFAEVRIVSVHKFAEALPALRSMEWPT